LKNEWHTVHEQARRTRFASGGQGENTFSKTFTEESRVSDAVVAVLAELGIEYVLGMPGGNTGPIFTALHDHSSIRVVQVREESIGSTMAEAYGRMTGKPLVVMGQGEWIAGNAGQGFMEALLGCSPLIILTEMSDGGSFAHHGYYQSGTGDYGNWDAAATLRGVTKRVMISHEPAQAVQHTQLAYKHAMAGEPGPVAVIFRSEALKGRVGPDSLPRVFPTRGYTTGRSLAIDVAAVDRAADVLREASRPVILAGNGVRVGQAWDSLELLARALDAPVATTAAGKGVFPEIDPLGAGVIGTFGMPTANSVVGQADLILAVGTKLGPIDTADESPELIDPTRQTLIQIDVEPLNVGWTFPVDHALIGDARCVLDHLRTAYESKGVGTHETTGSARITNVAISQNRGPEFSSEEVPMTPQRIIGVLQEAYAENGIVTCDAGENRLFMMHWYETKSANSYLQPAAGGGMGYAVSSALGAKLAAPTRPVLAVCGDGGFAMSIHALMTALQSDISIAVMVLNNNALGWVLHGMGERAVAATFDEFDHAAIARAVGCDGVRITSVDHLRDEISTIGDRTKPFVIDVPTSLNTSFKEIIQPLANYRRIPKTV
jgi:acetolactate synthase-1/2/3 large subunit